MSRGSFYTWVAVATSLIVFAGFARTLILVGQNDSQDRARNAT